MDSPVSPFWRSMYKYVPGVMSRKRASLMDIREWTWGFVAEAGGETAQLFADQSKQMMEAQVSSHPNNK